MNKYLVALAVPVLMVAGCASKPPQQEVASGAKPITVISPTQTTSQEPRPEVQTPPSTTSIPETPTAQMPDSMPRETDFNSADVSFLAESVVRSQRVLKASESYLGRTDISEKGQEIAKRLSAQHSARLTAQKELLALWGVSKPEAIFPANPTGIPTEAEIDQLGALHGADLDRRYAEIMLQNLESFGNSAKAHADKGFNPEVKEEVRLTLDELEKEKASFTEAMG